MNFSEFKKKHQKQEVEEYSNQANASPVVSVMVQTYQHKDYISECLEGILNQKTDFPIEILLGEDDSIDETKEICIIYANKYPEKIRLFLHHPENKIKVLGITTGNFNALYNFFSAKGEFIAFCEGDDLWTDPLKLQKQVDVLRQNPDLALTYHSFQEVNEKGILISENLRLEQSTQNISREDLKKFTFHPLLSTMCFRNFGNELPEQMAEVINVDSFLISLLGNYGTAEFLENIKPSYYRRHGGGIWSGRIKELKLKSKMLTFEKLRQYYSHKGEIDMAKFYRLNFKNGFKSLIYFHLRHGKVFNASRDFFFRSL